MNFYRLNNINETASAGAVGAGSIAVNMDGPSRRDIRTGDREFHSGARAEREKERKEKERREHVKGQLEKAKRLKAEREKEEKKKKGFKGFLRRKLVGESFDLNDVTSRLKSMDMEGDDTTDNNVVSYGIEDDSGNVMRVTVRSDQAQEFERTIAHELSDMKSDNLEGRNLKNVSLAELLFNLRDQFDIVTVDFPIIPTDAVYNAGQVDKAAPENEPQADEFSDMNDDNENSDFSDEDMNSEFPDEEENGGLPLKGEESENGEMPTNNQASSEENEFPPEEEGDNVEQFPEEEGGEEGTETLLKSLINMLTAQAEADSKDAEARAEEARAKQAEYSALGMEKELQKQEQMAEMEAELKADKEKKSEAKKIAQLAKYRANKKLGESFLIRAVDSLREEMAGNEQDNETPEELNRQMNELKDKYKIYSEDDPETRQYKQSQYILAKKVLDTKIQAARNRANFQQREQAKQRQHGPQQQQQQQQQQNI